MVLHSSYQQKLGHWPKMKFFSRYGIALFFAILLSASCIQNTKQNHDGLLEEKYSAYRKGDTAFLVLHHSKSVFKGVLMINYQSTYKDSGDVRGFIKGDTLIGDFSYKHYGQPTWYRDPIRLLKKGNKLIMGKGLPRLTVGIPNFNPAVPVDYNENTQLVFIKK
ncbi:hypothetical protein ACXZ1K_16605 [Pedobacter sp. PWIIR3]